MNQIIVIVGPSGSGKTHLSKELASHGIPKCITATTRSPRESEGEVDGRDYYFLSKSIQNDLDLSRFDINKKK